MSSELFLNDNLRYLDSTPTLQYTLLGTASVLDSQRPDILMFGFAVNELIPKRV